MTKDIVFLTDLHFSTSSNVRTGDFLEDLCKKLKWCVDYANNYNCDIILGGDLFDKPTVPDLVKTKVGKILLSIKEGLTIYSIYGNHDCLFNSEDNSYKTSYNLFVEFGVLTPITTIDFGGFILTSQKPLQSIGKPQLAVFHGFLNQEDKGWEVMLPDIATTDQAMVLLGHDHVEYEPVEFGSVRVIRPGSFARKTREEASLRQPNLIHIHVDTESDRVFKFKKVPIKVARDFKEIFKTKLETTSAAESRSYDEIINSLMQINQQDLSLEDALVQVTDEVTVEHIKAVLNDASIDKESK